MKITFLSGVCRYAVKRTGKVMSERVPRQEQYTAPKNFGLGPALVATHVPLFPFQKFKKNMKWCRPVYSSLRTGLGNLSPHLSVP